PVRFYNKDTPFCWIFQVLILQGACQRFALPALGRGRRSRPARKMLRRRKLLEIAAESPASGARFVGQIFVRLICFSFFKQLHQNTLINERHK
ncbi:MAG: hypothetical protein AABZ00_16500, partial [Chloroflexota bacterium]